MVRQYYKDDIKIENTEELNSLGYQSSSNEPIFKQIRVTKKDFSIFELYRKFKAKKLILEVDFQRKHVWSSKQRSELIESILMGLPLPIFYFKQQDDAKYVVVDGKQRLSTLFEFFENKFPLKNIKILKFLNGKRFEDLVGELGVYQAQLEDYQVYSHVILPPTPDKVLFDIFDRVNRGGTKLNKQEIRNALYHGDGFRMLDKIVKSTEFFEATNILAERDHRMKGSYLLTRFFAFYLLYNNQLKLGDETYVYNGDIDNLIELTLNHLNKISEKYLSELYQLACSCLIKTKNALGRGAFRKEMNESKPINMNIFETTMYFMTLIDIYDDESILCKIYDRIYDRIYDVITSDKFLDSIGNSRDNKHKVSIRFNMMREIAEDIENDR